MVLDWLLGNGFRYDGQSLEREPQRIKPHLRDRDGQPIWRRS
jgi:hypothetical protein